MSSPTIALDIIKKFNIIYYIMYQLKRELWNVKNLIFENQIKFFDISILISFNAEVRKWVVEDISFVSQR